MYTDGIRTVAREWWQGNESRSSQHVILKWPASPTPLQLQEAAELSGAWTNKVDSPAILGGQNSLTIAIDGDRRFCRLSP